MLRRVLVVAMVLLVLVQGLGPDMIGGGVVPLLLVLCGLAYGVLATDAENPTVYLVVVLAVGAAAGADVLSHIHEVGSYLDSILDAVTYTLVCICSDNLVHTDVQPGERIGGGSVRSLWDNCVTY